MFLYKAHVTLAISVLVPGHPQMPLPFNIPPAPCLWALLVLLLSNQTFTLDQFPPLLELHFQTLQACLVTLAYPWILGPFAAQVASGQFHLCLNSFFKQNEVQDFIFQALKSKFIHVSTPVEPIVMGKAGKNLSAGMKSS